MTDGNDFNEDNACEYTRQMWLRAAHKLADDAANEADPLALIRKCMMADACYWQATGTSEALTIKDFLIDASSAQKEQTQ